MAIGRDPVTGKFTKAAPPKTTEERSDQMRAVLNTGLKWCIGIMLFFGVIWTLQNWDKISITAPPTQQTAVDATDAKIDKLGEKIEQLVTALTPKTPAADQQQQPSGGYGQGQEGGQQAGDAPADLDGQIAALMEQKAAKLLGDPSRLPGYKGFAMTAPRRHGEPLPNPKGAKNCHLVKQAAATLPNGQRGTFWHKHCD